MHAVQVLILAALGLASTVQAFCKEPVGIRAMTDHMCKPVFCSIGGTCSYMPCHQITIYHSDGTSTSTGKLAGATPFRKGKQAEIGEWDYFGSEDSKGYSVFGIKCPNLGYPWMRCLKPGDIKRTNKSLPGVSYVYYDCGRVPPIPK
ncbi:hypothetical protein EC968_010247 [Mortierella alpina]|nr:hypothetical protein EC968_010247 [Mortierella alpina]